MTTVPYDVDRKAGTWVGAQATRRVRAFAALYGAMAAAFVISGAIWFSGQHLLALVPYAAFLCFAYAAREVIDSALPWRKGWSAETTVGDELDTLRYDGYIVMHDFMFGGEGNIDHLVSGPNGVFMVETKFRRYEDSQLGKAKRQAKKLHDELGCWVTPIICAGERKRTFPQRGVLVTGRGLVAEAIRNQPSRRPVDPERLARFADSLN